MIATLLSAAMLTAAQPGSAPAAQTAPARPSPFVPVTTGSVPPNPADVASIDAIMRAVYDVISGPAGQKRDWNRMRSLFTSNARLMPKGGRGLMSGSVEDYITSSGPQLEQNGFIEREIARRVEQYGDIAHVFSTYEARQSASGPVFLRGINSFQLVRHEGRWWVVSIMWQAESPQNPLPAQYLTSRPAGERG
ncbi:MAG TPA: hypothetical protein VEZ41_06920 [Allosphingosinicella sp.]|jgi:hypothetical protein|nr:hypothetical protein [Allosphingosinicella sp.]